MRNYDKLIEEYLKYMKVKNYAAGSIQNQRYHLSHLRDFLIQSKIEDITAVDETAIKNFINQQKYKQIKNKKTGKVKKMSPDFIRTKFLRIRKFFIYLLDHNKILYNPFDKIELPLPGLKLPKNILTEPEMYDLLNAPDLKTDTGRRDRAIIEVAYSSGLRRMELINLEVSDLNLSKGQIFIKQGKPRKDRVVPIGKSACKYVKLYLDETRPFLLVDSRIKNLFITALGQILTPSAITTILKTHVKRAKLNKKATWHTIRHTYATHLLQNGADIRYIKELLGHKSIESTKVYTRVYPGDLKKEITKYHPGQKKKPKKD